MPGPNAASQRRASSTRAAPAGRPVRPPGSQAVAGAQRHWLDVHEPDGRPRMIRPSAASRNSTNEVMFWLRP